MISRTIESVEIADKILFYEIHIENVEFHILGKTVKTNKWLRFEEWQQIYEQLNKTLSSYPTTQPDFTIKSFTVGNYIRVEIELFPIENCYSDLFKVKLENCTPDFLQVRIKQIALGSNLEEIQQAERMHKQALAIIAKRDRRETKKYKKKRRSTSLSEYDPVAVRKDQKKDAHKYIPRYKPSKLSPDYKETDEPYSPKPVNDLLDVENYSPYSISTADTSSSTPSVIPTYKPSAIVKRSSGHQSDESIVQNQDPEQSGSNQLSIKTEYDDIKDSLTPSPILDPSQHKAMKNRPRNRRPTSPESYGTKRSKLSQDLFDDSDDGNECNHEPKSENNQKLPYRTKRTPDEKKSENDASSPSTSKPREKSDTQSSDKHSTNQASAADKRKPRTPDGKSKTYDENLDVRLSRVPSKSMHSSSSKSSKDRRHKDGERKESKSSKSSRSGSRPSLSSQGSDSSKHAIEEGDQYKEYHEKRLDKTPTDISKIDLNNVRAADLVGTFEECKPKLDKLFEKYKDQRIRADSDKLYLLIQNVIDRKRVLAMIEHLASTYESEGVPKYTDLFAVVMVPEWVLTILMKEYDLTRDEAIDRLKCQRSSGAFSENSTV